MFAEALHQHRCAEHHHDGADVFAVLQVQRRLYGEHLRGAYGIPEALGRAAGRWTALLRRWRDAPATGAAHRATAPLQFYDTWVARDDRGDLFAKTAPYAT